ncbi:uncharacterized protein A4U43_C01F17190 [Asparagus officinalis]|uniref:Avr9/Cf-9 rapidly elicited protein 146 n=1 Tax=Asparagus officinalis TaxID=4686 RepID=A0A5P1FQ18_ASPOF|nr:uncharacterized protein LOC109842537 [Asparagus officinalis]ONK80395.1 uncharacterized protein A4U43_C01F17190 [Asparagus officinalis]
MQITKMHDSCGSPPPALAKKLLHIFKIIRYVLKKCLTSKNKLMMDLHLLLKRGKIAGKSLANLIHFHHHHNHHSPRPGIPSSSFSCRSMDPNLSFCSPREVEFSCSNSPIQKNRNKNYPYDFEALTAIAKAFEMLNSNNNINVDEVSDAESVAPSPMIAFGKSTPLTVRQLRITDSPFPMKEDEVNDGKIDKEADEFIKMFYKQLRMQQSLATATPEYKFRRG